jgi:hypothetical protein
VGSTPNKTQPKLHTQPQLDPHSPQQLAHHKTHRYPGSWGPSSFSPCCTDCAPHVCSCLGVYCEAHARPPREANMLSTTITTRHRCPVPRGTSRQSRQVSPRISNQQLFWGFLVRLLFHELLGLLNTATATTMWSSIVYRRARVGGLCLLCLNSY